MPLGIGTAGYNGIGAASSPSPYVKFFPATTRLHGHPTLKAVVLSRGPGFRVVFVRTDQIAVAQQLRDSVLAELYQRTGIDFDDSLILAATHTHAGPGRFLQGDAYSVATDTFFPDFYQRLVTALADVVTAAYDDLDAAELGYVLASSKEAHSDRRCEDLTDYTNDTMPLVVVRKQGQVSAVIVSYAVHGTVLGIKDLTLSQEVSGAIEEKIAELFDHPVDVMFLNSWAADMSPGNPELPGSPEPSLQPRGFDRMDRVGAYVAAAAKAALEELETTVDPVIDSQTRRYVIDRSTIGYASEEFPYEYGALFCSADGESCDELMHLEAIDRTCFGLSASEPAPNQSVFTVGQLGDLHFVTWGGEPSTSLAESVIDKVSAFDGVGEVLFVGYANDYLGYQLLEEDWYHGGYEAAGGMWGPKQGAFMSDRLLQTFDHFKTGASLPFVEPLPPETFSTADAIGLVAEEANERGSIAEQPAETYNPGDVVQVAIYGPDPWVGAPTALLQRQGTSDFADLIHTNATAYDSNGYGFWIDLETEPSYAETIDRVARHFKWTFHMPLRRSAGGLPGSLTGTFRFRLLIPTKEGDVLEVTSGPFTVAGG